MIQASTASAYVRTEEPVQKLVEVKGSTPMIRR